jgi:LPXTG-site transpeptidase (sortase) family protein
VTKAKAVGCIFLGGGTLIVLAVALIWLLAPMMSPHSPNAQTVLEAPSGEFMAPALSPFTPPTPATSDTPAATEHKLVETAVKGEPVEPHLSPPHDRAPSGWHIISYPDTPNLVSQLQAQPEESLRLAIPSLQIDAPVLPVGLVPRWNESRRQQLQWSVPDEYAVGWHESSARPGQPGNTVLNGHNNIYGSIFGKLVDLSLGDEIVLKGNGRNYIYQVTQREFLREEGESLRTRLRNARWIAPSNDTRLTLVTCWPNTSNTHRLVVIAQPVGIEDT